jgi:hypothetical protein
MYELYPFASPMIVTSWLPVRVATEFRILRPLVVVTSNGSATSVFGPTPATSMAATGGKASEPAITRPISARP